MMGPKMQQHCDSQWHVELENMLSTLPVFNPGSSFKHVAEKSIRTLQNSQCCQQTHFPASASALI